MKDPSLRDLFCSHYRKHDITRIRDPSYISSPKRSEAPGISFEDASKYVSKRQVFPIRLPQVPRPALLRRSSGDRRHVRVLCRYAGALGRPSVRHLNPLEWKPWKNRAGGALFEHKASVEYTLHTSANVLWRGAAPCGSTRCACFCAGGMGTASEHTAVAPDGIAQLCYHMFDTTEIAITPVD